MEDANDRALRSSQAWTDGAARFLKDYVAESNDCSDRHGAAFANAFSGAEDSLVGFIATGKLEFRSLADSVLADLARTTVRQMLTAPLAGALESAFAGGGLFGLWTLSPSPPSSLLQVFRHGLPADAFQPAAVGVRDRLPRSTVR